MIITRADLDRGRTDLKPVVTGRRLPLVHPGEILQMEFLAPLDISVYSLAKAVHVPRSRMNDIVLGRRAISGDTSLRLARYFGTTAEFWENLQSRFDLDSTKRTLSEQIAKEVAPRAA